MSLQRTCSHASRHAVAHAKQPWPSSRERMRFAERWSFHDCWAFLSSACLLRSPAPLRFSVRRSEDAASAESAHHSRWPSTARPAALPSAPCVPSHLMTFLTADQLERARPSHPWYCDCCGSARSRQDTGCMCQPRHKAQWVREAEARVLNTKRHHLAHSVPQLARVKITACGLCYLIT